MGGPSGAHPLEAAMRAYVKAARAQRARTRVAQQRVSKMSFRQRLKQAFNPLSADKKATQFKSLGERANEMIKAQKEADKQRVLSAEDLAQMAGEHQEAYPELDAEMLLQLRGFFLREKLDAETILNQLLGVYGDPTLADQALGFMIDTTTDEMQRSMLEARNLLYERFGRETIAGHNVGGDVQEFGETGIGTPTEMRDLYRDVTGNPREHNQLFAELTGQYAYAQVENVVDFLLKSLGSDLKAKGSSIPRGELHRLLTEVRTLQSILGVFLFFRGRSDLIKKLLEEAGYELAEGVDFETLAREFMGLVDERYPTPSKIYGTSSAMEIEGKIIPQIVVFQQFRDAIRQVAPRIYRSLQHRYDLLTAIIETLEELEDELHEREEMEE
jgi:type III secretion protein W